MHFRYNGVVVRLGPSARMDHAAKQPSMQVWGKHLPRCNGGAKKRQDCSHALVHTLMRRLALATHYQSCRQRIRSYSSRVQLPTMITASSSPATPP